ncbi:MAG: MBL fold metallo-hydrolase [Acidobacteria bacterium]|nr:MBL fold metallo-hydrolase [Acidobacteriota bacterium]
MADRKWIPIVFIGIAILWCATAISYAVENALLVRLTDEIYARIVNPDGNAVGNAGFIILEQGVLVFDTHFTPEAGRQLRDDIRLITRKPVRYVVNSHYHPDHTHGNQAFPGAHIIAIKKTREGILQKDLPSLNRTMSVTASQLDRMRGIASRETDPDKLKAIKRQIQTDDDYLATLSQLKITAPVVVMDDYLEIQDGSRKIKIQFLGAGHTESDTILIIPSERIVFCGDLFFKDAIPNIQDADILKWMETLKKILELDADRFVPGHGIVGNRPDVERFLAYFEELKSLVEPFVLRGDSVERAIREIRVPKQYSRYRFMNFFSANIQRMYAELKREQLLSIPIEGPKLPANR